MLLLSKVVGHWSGKRLLLAALVLCLIIGLALYWFWDWYRLDKKYSDAQAALANHQLARAKTLFEECAEARPDDAEVYFFLARTARRMDLPGKANHYLAQAERLGSVAEFTRLERMLLQFQLGKGQEHEKTLWNLVNNRHADAATVLEALGKGYRRNYSLSQALHCFKLIVEDEPDHGPAWILRGQVQELLGMPDRAVESYQTAIPLVPNHPVLRERSAMLLLEINKPAEALVLLDQMAKEQAKAAPAVLYRIQAHLELGRFQEARELLQQTGLDLRKDALASYLQGRSLLLEARHAEAEDWFRLAIKLGPGAPRPIHGLVQCLNHLGKEMEADDWSQKLAVMDQQAKKIKELTQEVIGHPDRPEPRYQLGALKLNEPNSDQAALAWIQSALDLDPTHAGAHALLAAHYRRQGNLELADWHERALKKQ